MFIDLHCDALHRYRWQGGSLSASAGSVDLPRLRAGGALCQCFALFVDTAHTPDAYGEALALARLFRRELAAHPHEICQVTTAAELRQAGERGLIGALLTIEEGAVCRNGAETLREFYELGVRMMTLTWNHKNRFAAPNAAGEPPKAAVSGEGLTRAGLELIDAMNELGVLADVSHLSDAGFWQLAARVKGPFVASHSNARAVCGHPRNLTDDMIRALAKKGGVMGLNFLPRSCGPVRRPAVSGTWCGSCGISGRWAEAACWRSEPILTASADGLSLPTARHSRRWPSGCRPPASAAMRSMDLCIKMHYGCLRKRCDRRGRGLFPLPIRRRGIYLEYSSFEIFVSAVQPAGSPWQKVVLSGPAELRCFWGLR